MANETNRNPVRKYRKDLVRAAEKAVRSFSDKVFSDLKKTQLPHLVSLANQASCHEEIVNFLRYQSARRRGPWPGEAVDKVVSGIEGVFKEAKDLDDDAKVRAWALYALFLTRAYTYESKAKGAK